MLIGENIKQLQGSDTHKGKRPRYHYQEEGEQCSVETLSGQGENVWEGELDIEEQIRILDARLQEAIAREEYEVAAQCRDKIRELKEEIGKC